MYLSTFFFMIRQNMYLTFVASETTSTEIKTEEYKILLLASTDDNALMLSCIQPNVPFFGATC